MGWKPDAEGARAGRAEGWAPWNKMWATTTVVDLDACKWPLRSRSVDVDVDVDVSVEASVEVNGGVSVDINVDVHVGVGVGVEVDVDVSWLDMYNIDGQPGDKIYRSNYILF